MIKISQIPDGSMTAKEIKIILYRFGLDRWFVKYYQRSKPLPKIFQPRTLEETGKFFGITRERVRQIEQKSLYKIELIMEMKVLYEKLNKEE